MEVGDERQSPAFHSSAIIYTSFPQLPPLLCSLKVKILLSLYKVLLVLLFSRDTAETQSL